MNDMLTKEEVLHVAHLARIEISEDEIKKYQKDLKALLDDSQETELMEFIEEYNKSEDIKKVSMVTTNMRSKIQSIRLFCAKKLTDIANLLGVFRIEDEIIPFITDLILNYEDDGEVLSEFSN